MIVKSSNLNSIKNFNSEFFLLYGENEGFKEEVINDFFLRGFNGEVLKYDENQILENKNDFYDVCLNESLFDDKKIIIISRVSAKLFEVINDLIARKLNNKKIIFNSSALEKKSKLRQLFEKTQDLVCIPFYQDNLASLFKIASDIFKKNKVSISSENINLIIEKCSGDRKNLNNEISKILNFCFQEKKINRDQILKLINLYEDENYFELIDNCLAKNHLKVCKIINNNNFNKAEGIIIIRSFLSRVKRLLELKKLQIQMGNIGDTINNFRPQIFWKDKEIVQKQLLSWKIEQIYELIDKVNLLEVNFKKNSNISNNLIYDLILNISNN